MAKDIGGELIAGRKIMRPWLGIRIETLGDDPSIRELFKGIDKGVVVRTIEADAPAYKSDLRPFDVITQVDENPVLTDSQLQHEILKKKIGQKVELTVWRKGQTVNCRTRFRARRMSRRARRRIAKKRPANLVYRCKT